MNDGQHAIGVHLVASSVDHELRNLRAGQEADGIDATGKGEVTDEHVDAIIEVATDVVDEFVVLDGKSGAGFPGVSAEPCLLIEDGARLAPDTEMSALCIAVKAFLPSEILRLAVQKLVRHGHGGIVGESEKGRELLEESQGGIVVAGELSRGGEGILELRLGTDKEEIDEIGVFPVRSGGAVRQVLEKQFNIAALVFIELAGDTG